MDYFWWYLAIPCCESEIKAAGREHTCAFKSSFWGGASRNLGFTLISPAGGQGAVTSCFLWLSGRGVRKAKQASLWTPCCLGQLQFMLGRQTPQSPFKRPLLFSINGVSNSSQPVWCGENPQHPRQRGHLTQACTYGGHRPQEMCEKWGSLSCMLLASSTRQQWDNYSGTTTSDSHSLWPPDCSAVKGCLQELGNLPSHKKTNPRNVSHHFGNPTTMELHEPRERNFFLKPKCMDLSVNYKVNFCLIFSYILITDFKKCKALPSSWTYFLYI